MSIAIHGVVPEWVSICCCSNQTHLRRSNPYIYISWIFCFIYTLERICTWAEPPCEYTRVRLLLVVMARPSGWRGAIWWQELWFTFRRRSCSLPTYVYRTNAAHTSVHEIVVRLVKHSVRCLSLVSFCILVILRVDGGECSQILQLLIHICTCIIWSRQDICTVNVVVKIRWGYCIRFYVDDLEDLKTYLLYI